SAAACCIPVRRRHSRTLLADQWWHSDLDSPRKPETPHRLDPGGNLPGHRRIEQHLPRFCRRPPPAAERRRRRLAPGLAAATPGRADPLPRRSPPVTLAAAGDPAAPAGTAGPGLWPA